MTMEDLRNAGNSLINNSLSHISMIETSNGTGTFSSTGTFIVEQPFPVAQWASATDPHYNLERFKVDLANIHTLDDVVALLSIMQLEFTFDPKNIPAYMKNAYYRGLLVPINPKPSNHEHELAEVNPATV